MPKTDHVSETPATAMLKACKVAFTEHAYDYLEHGGAQHSARVLGVDPFWQGQGHGAALMPCASGRHLTVAAIPTNLMGRATLPCQGLQWRHSSSVNY